MNVFRLWAFVFAVLLTGVAPAIPAPEADPLEVVEQIHLEHVTGVGMLRLLTSESPEPPKPGVPNGLCSKASLAPDGIRGMIGFPEEGRLVLTGTPSAMRILKAALPVVDVQPEPAGNQEVRVFVTPVKALLPDVREAALRLPAPGKVATDGKRLELRGKPGWVYRALRATLRLEIAAVAAGAPGQP